MSWPLLLVCLKIHLGVIFGNGVLGTDETGAALKSYHLPPRSMPSDSGLRYLPAPSKEQGDSLLSLCCILGSFLLISLARGEMAKAPQDPNKERVQESLIKRSFQP